MAEFDNSDQNLNNPDPKATVGFGDQTFEEMMIGFFEVADPHQDLTRPQAEQAKLPEPSRVEQFMVILKATGGEPDDNVKAATYLALSDAEWFGRFGFILPTLVPQVDRVCITMVADGKVVQKFGPFQQRMGKDGKPMTPPETIRSDLPESDADSEPLAKIVAGDQPVVIADLSQAKGKIFERMAARRQIELAHPGRNRRPARQREFLEHRAPGVSAAGSANSVSPGQGHDRPQTPGRPTGGRPIADVSWLRQARRSDLILFPARRV